MANAGRMTQFRLLVGDQQVVRPGHGVRHHNHCPAQPSRCISFGIHQMARAEEGSSDDPHIGGAVRALDGSKEDINLGTDKFFHVRDIPGSSLEPA